MSAQTPPPAIAPPDGPPRNGWYGWDGAVVTAVHSHRAYRRRAPGGYRLAGRWPASDRPRGRPAGGQNDTIANGAPVMA